jgi:hypothetical protein
MKLAWVEPKSYWEKKLGSNGQPWIKTFLYGLALFTFAAGARYLSSRQTDHQNTPINWPIFLGGAFAASQLIAFLWPRLIRLLSASHVIISEKGINNNLQFGTRFDFRFWSWEKLGSVGASVLEGQDILVLRAPDGSEIERLGLRSKPNRDQIKQAVEHFGGCWQDEGPAT